jgi:hypothetical protein
MKAKARSYFRQVAEPVPPNQPTIGARRGAYLRTGRPIDVPVILEQNPVESNPVTPARKKSLAPQPSWREFVQVDYGPSSPEPVQRLRDSLDSAAERDTGTAEEVATQTKRKAKPQVDERSGFSTITKAVQTPAETRTVGHDAVIDSSNILGVSQRPPGKPVAPSPGPASPIAGRLDLPSAAELMRTNTDAVPPMGPKEILVVQPNNTRAAQDATTLHSEKRRGPETSTGEQSVFRQQPRGFDDGRPVERSARASVHIGTVEVRSIVVQPPAPPTAPATPQTAVQPMRSARAGTVEPLTRSLAWSFGLVQG